MADRYNFTATFNRRLAAEIGDELKRGFLAELVNDAVEVAQQLVPVDTGELRDSIRGVVDGSGEAVEGVVVANADHAAAVEFGTGDTDPQPFLRPAGWSIRRKLR